MSDQPMKIGGDGGLVPLTPADIALQAALAAQETADPAPRQALGPALRDALKAQGWDPAWQTALLGQSQDTRDWWTSGYRDQIPITATKLLRVVKACVPPVDLPALFTAVGA